MHSKFPKKLGLKEMKMNEVNGKVKKKHWDIKEEMPLDLQCKF